MLPKRRDFLKGISYRLPPYRLGFQLKKRHTPTMLIRAGAVLTMLDEPLVPGCVRVRDGKIQNIGEWLEPEDNEEEIFLMRHVLMPGMINAHCHLDYTGFRGTIFGGQLFTRWLERMNSLKRDFPYEDYPKMIQAGWDALAKTGCTTVFNIASFPEVVPDLPPPPIRIWWFWEVMGNVNRVDETKLKNQIRDFPEWEGWLGGAGVSPHAPYTTSVENYRIAHQLANEHQLPLTTHIAESVDEHEMFVNAQGTLYDFFQRAGRKMSDCGWGSPLSHLFEHGILTPQMILVHLNYLQAYDYSILRAMLPPVVHCPKCHAYFGHARFPLEKIRDTGCPVALGTDSLASNNSLDLRSEIRHARQNYPGVSNREWLQMATTNPAKMLGLQDKLGAIRPGAWADLTAFPLPERTDPYEAVIRSKGFASFLMVNGKTLWLDQEE